MELEGIITLDGPIGNNAGHFTLPREFDQRIHSAQWTRIGPEVEQAKQAQPILGTNMAAVGWEIWKFPKGHKDQGKPHKVTVKNGEYVLMFRKKTISDNVNRIYGNVSKRHLVREQRGETIAGQPVRDPGVLANERIGKQYGIRDFGEDYEMNLPDNPVNTATTEVAAEPDASASTEGE